MEIDIQFLFIYVLSDLSGVNKNFKVFENTTTSFATVKSFIILF